MKWFLNLKLQNKLFIVFGFFVSLMIFMISFSYYEISRVSLKYNDLLTSYVMRKKHIAGAISYLDNLRYINAHMKYYIDSDDRDNIIVNLDNDIKNYSDGFLNHLNEFREIVINDTISLSDEERLKRCAIVDEIKYTFNNYYKEIGADLFDAYVNNDGDKMTRVVFSLKPKGDVLSSNMQSLLDLVILTGEVKISQAMRYSLNVTNVLVIVCICMCIFSMLIALYLAKIMKNPIEKMEYAMNEISRGNLNYPIRSEYKDELGALSNHIGNMVEKIAEMNKTMAIFDNIDCMICVVDLHYNLKYINEKMLTAYGVDKETFVNPNGKKCFEIIRNLDKPCANCLLPKIMFQPEQVMYSDDHFTYDEKLNKWLSVKASLIRWVDGSQVQFYYLTDETVKKNHIDGLKKYEKQLSEALQAAKNASLSKSAFLANMSHEIRTPMNSIIGFSELAMDDILSTKEVNDYLSKIKENSEWLLQIINDILDISKIESGKIEIENIPFVLSDIFNSCRNAVMHKVSEKGLTLYCYAEPSIGKKLLGDPTRLRQVFTNLLSNAIKFTHVGVIKLFSSIVKRTDNSSTIYFEVKDSGIGMTPEQVKKIFDPFIQADISTTRQYGGTGLGLSITKNIIELMGGELIVESAPRIGSKFSFEMTFKTIDSPFNIGNDEIVINQLERPHFEGTILICEDNLINQKVIGDHLSRIGLETVLAENGKVGVELIKARIRDNVKPFDLIFMDIHMPVMDGLDASAIINKMNVKTPIVALTANIMVSDKETYKAHGINDLLGKPFTSQELWGCLLKYLTPMRKKTAGEILKTEIENQKKVDNNKSIVEYQKNIIEMQNNPNETPTAFDELDEELRMMLLEDFYKEIQTKFQEITDAIVSGDFKLAYRHAHTLKGNAGLFKKHRLRDAAADVQHNLNDGKNTLNAEHLSTLENELKAVINELESLFNK